MKIQQAATNGMFPPPHKTEHQAIICLGSNVHPRTLNINLALKQLGKIIYIDACSEVYETPSHTGFGDAYLNAVLRAKTEMDAEKLALISKEIEKEIGRTLQDSICGRVVMDIDVVGFDGKILRENDFNALHFQLGFKQINRTSQQL